MQSNLYVSKRITSDGDRLAAQKAVEQLLAEHTIDFNAVFAPTDEDGLGVLQALKPVSYTHIDVYKRQPLTCLKDGKMWKKL